MKHKEIQVEIPTSWEDISIGMYQKFKQIENTKYENDEEKVVDLLCTMTKISREELAGMRYKDMKYLANKLSKLMAEEIKDDELIKTVEFKGVEYGIIPNFSTITLGEFVDIESYCKDAYKNLHKITSVMYRPIVKKKGDRYSIEEYKPNELIDEDFLDFPILVSVSALSFFFRLGKILKQAMLKYSIQKVNKRIAKLRRLVKNGGGLA